MPRVCEEPFCCTQRWHLSLPLLPLAIHVERNSERTASESAPRFFQFANLSLGEGSVAQWFLPQSTRPRMTVDNCSVSEACLTYLVNTFSSGPEPNGAVLSQTRWWPLVASSTQVTCVHGSGVPRPQQAPLDESVEMIVGACRFAFCRMCHCVGARERSVQQNTTAILNRRR